MASMQDAVMASDISFTKSKPTHYRGSNLEQSLITHKNGSKNYLQNICLQDTQSLLKNYELQTHSFSKGKMSTLKVCFENLLIHNLDKLLAVRGARDM